MWPFNKKKKVVRRRVESPRKWVDMDATLWWNSLSLEEKEKRLKHFQETGRWDDEKPVDQLQTG